MTDYRDITESVISGDGDASVGRVKEALAQGEDPKKILDIALVPAMTEIGNRFSRGELFFPELLMGGEAMTAAVEELRPHMAGGDVPKVGKFLIGTVKDDMHDIGKNIVITFLEANGWEVTDLGIDNSPEKFCEALRQDDFDVVGLSSLLTLTMQWQAETIKMMKKEGLLDKVKVMVGGVPVNQEWADKIGADAWGKDAVDTVKNANKLIA